MTKTTITTCDRCGDDVTNSAYFQLERLAISSNVDSETIDLCGECERTFDRFMRPPATALRTFDDNTARYRTFAVGEGT